jgi:hypothetical protein
MHISGKKRFSRVTGCSPLRRKPMQCTRCAVQTIQAVLRLRRCRQCEQRSARVCGAALGAGCQAKRGVRRRKAAQDKTVACQTIRSACPFWCRDARLRHKPFCMSLRIAVELCYIRMFRGINQHYRPTLRRQLLRDGGIRRPRGRCRCKHDKTRVLARFGLKQISRDFDFLYKPMARRWRCTLRL